MKGLKWWLWIVGIFYLLEGGGTTLLRLTDPEAAAAIWTPTGRPGMLDPFAVEAVLAGSLFASLSWLVLGIMLLAFTRMPAKAGLLVIVVAALEIFAWLPVDIVALTYGWPVPRTAALMAVHLAIGMGGVLALRASGATRAAHA